MPFMLAGRVVAPTRPTSFEQTNQHAFRKLKLCLCPLDEHPLTFLEHFDYMNELDSLSHA
jgi:hypothetical protein